MAFDLEPFNVGFTNAGNAATLTVYDKDSGNAASVCLSTEDISRLTKLLAVVQQDTYSVTEEVNVKYIQE